jgi:hypothetical protein
MNEVDSSRDIVHNPPGLMTRLAIMWHENRRLGFLGGFWKEEEDMTLSLYVYGAFLPTCRLTDWVRVVWLVWFASSDTILFL